MLNSIIAKWPIARFVGVIAGNGAATGISFATAVVAARVLSQSDFVVYNTLALMGAMVSVAGGGVDSSTTRMVANSTKDRESILNLIRIATALRLTLAFILLPLLVPFLYKIALSSQFGYQWTFIGLVGFVLHATLLSCFTIEPQATGAFLQNSVRQATVYLYIFLSVVLVFMGAPIEILMIAPLLSAVVLIAVISKSLNFRLKFSIPSGYRELATYLTVASIIYALIDRLDTYAVVATQTTAVAAEYSIAARYAGGMALIGSAFTAYILPKVARATNVDEILYELSQHKKHWFIVLVVAIFASSVSYYAIKLIFNLESLRAATISAIIIFQYPIMAAYIGLVIGLTNLTDRRVQVILPVFMLAVKIAFLPLVLISPVMLALGTPLAHLAGGAYIFVKMRNLKKDCKVT